YQREYHKRTGKHLDEDGWTWLPESTRPVSRRVPYGLWGPGSERLSFYSFTRDLRYDGLGCRLAGSFEIEI
ncbi:MAG: 5 protein, partial [Parcubacteria group bacterium]|nr:5 protein [Parcubacteria group bacterium]